MKTSYPCASVSIRGLIIALGFYRVIPLTRLHLPVLVAGTDLDMPEGSIFGRIGGCVADRVLAAHFRVEFVEGILQRHLAVNLENMAAGIVRHLTQRPGVAPAEHDSAASPVELAIHVK